MHVASEEQLSTSKQSKMRFVYISREVFTVLIVMHMLVMLSIKNPSPEVKIVMTTSLFIFTALGVFSCMQDMHAYLHAYNMRFPHQHQMHDIV